MKKTLLLIGLVLGLSVISFAQTIFTETFTGTTVPPAWYSSSSYTLTANDKLFVHMIDSVGPMQTASSPAANWATFSYDFTIEYGGAINMAAGCKCITFDINNSGNAEIDLFVQVVDGNNNYTDGTFATIAANYVGPVTINYSGKFKNNGSSTLVDSTNIVYAAFQPQGKDLGVDPWNLKFKGDFTLDNVAVAGIYSAFSQIYVDNGGSQITNGQTFNFGTVSTGNSSQHGLSVINNSSTNTDLNISSMTLSGTNASEFSFSIDGGPAPLAIAANDYEYLYVTFTPNSAGTKTAKLTITTDDPFNPIFVLNLTATGTGATLYPEIDVRKDGTSGTSIASGGTNTLPDVVNNTAGNLQNISIVNTGNGSLSVTNIVLSGTNSSMFTLSNLPTLPYTIPAGDSWTFGVTFNPTSLGVKTATVTISNNDSNEGTYAITLSANSIATGVPEINLQDDENDNIPVGGSFSLGEVASTTNQVFTFYIENIGTADLNVSNIQLGGTNASLFTLQNVPTYPATVSAGDYVAFQVKFAPTSIGNKTATITVTNNDSDEGSYTFTLTGTALPAPAPSIEVYNYIVGDMLSGSSVTLPPVVVNGNSVNAYPIYLRDNGNADLNIASITIAGTDQSQFSLTGLPTFPYTLNSFNTNYSPGISFNPTSVGAKTATLLIVSNDPTTPTYSIILHATSTATAAPEINMEFDYNTVLKGGSTTVSNVAVGDDYYALVNIQNNGTSDLTVTNMALSGTNASEFQIHIPFSYPLTVGASSSQSFYVSFNPTSTGAKTATLTISNNDSDEGSYTIIIHATAVNPSPEITVIDFNDQNVAKGGISIFPSVVVNQTSGYEYISVHNDGTADLTISNITITGANQSEFQLQSGITPFTVNSGDNNSFYVVFAPTSTGVKTATLTITNNDSDEGVYTITLKGTATATAAPNLDVYDYTHNYNLIPSGGSYTFTSVLNNTVGNEEYIRVFNSGTANLNVSNITITGTNASEFILQTFPLPAELDANNDGQFYIIFAPTSVGNKTATLTFTSDDPTDGTYTINLMATSVATATPEIAVMKGYEGSIVASGGTITMASVVNNTPGNAQTIVIENTGLGNLTISNITLTGTNASEFILDPLSFPMMVSGNNDIGINVTFVPTSLGNKTATLTITSNDSDEGTYTITLNASSVATATPEINVRATADIASGGTLSLSDALPGSTGDAQTIYIENLGAGNLNISSVTLTGTNTSEFIVTLPTFPTYVVPGDVNDWITVTFAPTSLGTKTAVLTITSDDADESSYVINLTANATATSVSSVQSFIADSKVYPNPTSDMANLELSLKSESAVKVILSDLMGKEVMTIAEGNYSTLNQSFSVAVLSRGIYTITYFVNGASSKSELLMVK